MISNQLNNDKEYFTNFYMNLFNLLIMIDLNEDNSKKNIALIYNGRNIFIDENSYYGKDYKDDELFYSVMFGKEVTTPNKFIISRIDHFLQMDINDQNEYFNVLSNIVYITKNTYDILINLKTNLFESDDIKNYDLLAEDIEYLSLLSQKSLVKYLKNKVRDKSYRVYDLFKDYILSLDSIIDNEKVYYKYKSTDILKYLPDLNISDDLNYYLVCNYNKLYNMIYIDSLVLITIYTKYLTIFQLKVSEDSNLKSYSILLSKIGLFNVDFMALKESINDLDKLNFKQERILLSKYPINGTDADLNNICSINIMDMSFNSTYSIANSIMNFFILSFYLLKDTYLYIPAIDNILLYKMITDITTLTFYTDASIHNHQTMFIDIYSSKTDYDNKYSFSRFIKFANADSSSCYSDKVRFDNQPINGFKRNNMACENLSIPTSIFRGRYQNINKGMYFNTRIQYNSSVWLRPLFNSELITSYTLLSHFVQLSKSVLRNNESINSSLTVLRNNPDKDDLYDYLYGMRDINYVHHIINSEMPINEHNDYYLYNNVSYITSLGSMYILRCYMICILEYFSRQYDIKLKRLTDDEDDIFKKYFFDTRNLKGTYKGISSNHYKMNTQRLNIKQNNFYITTRYLEQMSFNENRLIHSNLDYFEDKFHSDAFNQTFYLYFNNAFKITHSMLEQICNIAKEDYISCPYL